MRIDAYNQIAQVYSAGRPARTNRNPYVNQVQAPADDLQISQLGKDYQTARAAVAGAPDIREDVVAVARQNLESGKYDNLSGASFADRLLEKYEAAQALA
ncbi:MAG: flagellar biosynthesis anti-sigma factor FlgM [Lachnospiraceae bacterium]|nr:flagellar biosynthesis anti-sigma factor FlgM [Lachnospiraceae bacterium]